MVGFEAFGVQREQAVGEKQIISKAQFEHGAVDADSIFQRLFVGEIYDSRIGFFSYISP